MGEVVAVNGDLTVINCAACGYAHLYPRPDMDGYYESDRFYSEHSPYGWLMKEVEEYRAGLWDSAYEYQMSLLAKDLWLVDVGTGTGTFVDYCCRHNHPFVYGIEPSESARIVSPTKPGYILPDLGRFEKRARTFNRGDMNVRMSLVLEHIYDPVQFIQEYKPLMGETGKLMVVVPNEFNPLQRKVGGNWFVSGVHINYFTPQSLQEMLESVGLRVLYQGATFPTELFILAGLDHRNNPELGKKLHWMRLVFERRVGPRVFDWYKMLFDRWGWGREVVMVAEAKSV